MRRFDIGRQSESLMNEKLYKIVKNIETLNASRQVSGEEPEAKADGSLWIDNDAGDLKYSESGEWNIFYGDKFRMITEILSPTTPKDPVSGQLWIKNGVLLYFDGYEWRVSKADDLNEIEDGFNISAYKDFLAIDPIKSSGEHVIISTHGTPIEFSQFLIPNVETDRFFVEGYNTADFERLTNVSLQYRSELLRNKTTSAIHVNPEKLIRIEKKMLLVDKRPDVPLDIDTSNTEMYGMAHGVGKLLLKGIDFREDSSGRPVLSNKAKSLYDFVLCNKYIFGEPKRSGKMIRTIKNINEENLIDLSNSMLDESKNPLLFVNGKVEEASRGRFSIDYNKKQVTIKNIEVGDSILLIAVSESSFGEPIIPTSLSASSGIIIELPEKTGGYEKPVAVITDGDNTFFEEVENYNHSTGIGEIKRGDLDSEVYVIDMPKTDSGYDMHFVSSGACSGPISISSGHIPSDKYVLFVDGESVSKKDFIINTSTMSIESHKFISGSRYMLFRDRKESVLFDDIAYHLLTPSYGTDSSLVFMKGNIICDASSVAAYFLSSEASVGEIKNIIREHGESEWHVCYGKDSLGKSLWKKLKGKTSRNVKTLRADHSKIITGIIQVYKDEDKVSSARSHVDKIITSPYVENSLTEFGGKISINISRSDTSLPVLDKDWISIILDESGAEESVTITLGFEVVDVKIPDNIYIEELIHAPAGELDETSESIVVDEIISAVKDINYTVESFELADGSTSTRKTYKDLDVDVSFISRGQSVVSAVEIESGYKETLGYIEHLEKTKNGYAQDKRSINVINSYGYEDFVSYSYKYASSIEDPLELYEKDIYLSDNKNGYKVTHRQFYNPGTNGVAIWLDGVRQYAIEEIDEKTIKLDTDETSTKTSRPLKMLVASNYDMYSSSKTAKRVVLGVKDTVPGMYNTYSTGSINLYPGFVTLYIDGIRQCSDKFQIISKNKIFINDETLSSFSSKSKILIEIRKDTNYSEQSIEVKEPLLNGIIDVEKHKIDRSIISAGEKIMIFINGIAYGSRYSIDRDKGHIVLNAEDAEKIGLGYFHPSNYSGTITRKSKDIITFEWR